MNENLSTSAAGKAFIKSFESCRLKAYPDPATKAAPWTCGWGSTGSDIGPNTVWTQAQADSRFDVSLYAYEHIIKSCVTVQLTQYQFDALVSFVYNVGTGKPGFKDGFVWLKHSGHSTMLNKINAGGFAGAAAEFPKWANGNGSVMGGLVRRRAAEQAMFEGH